MTRDCQWSLGVLNEIFSLDVSDRGTCQYPFVRSNIEMKFVDPRHGVAIERRYFMQPSEVIAEPEGAVGLRDHYYGA